MGTCGHRERGPGLGPEVGQRRDKADCVHRMLMRQDVTMAGALGDSSKCCRDTSQKCGNAMASIK